MDSYLNSIQEFLIGQPTYPIIHYKILFDFVSQFKCSKRELITSFKHKYPNWVSTEIFKGSKREVLLIDTSAHFDFNKFEKNNSHKVIKRKKHLKISPKIINSKLNSNKIKKNHPKCNDNFENKFHNQKINTETENKIQLSLDMQHLPHWINIDLSLYSQFRLFLNEEVQFNSITHSVPSNKLNNDFHTLVKIINLSFSIPSFIFQPLYDRYIEVKNFNFLETASIKSTVSKCPYFIELPFQIRRDILFLFPNKIKNEEEFNELSMYYKILCNNALEKNKINNKIIIDYSFDFFDLDKPLDTEKNNYHCTKFKKEIYNEYNDAIKYNYHSFLQSLLNYKYNAIKRFIYLLSI